MTTTRAHRADALERWAEKVDVNDLVEARTAALRAIAELVEQRDGVDTALLDAIRSAREADRSWSKSERCWVSLSRRRNANTPPSSPRSLTRPGAASVPAISFGTACGSFGSSALAGGSGDEGGHDVGGVPVEAAPGPVVTHRGSRVGVTGCFLNIPQRHTGVEGGGDERVPETVR